VNKSSEMSEQKRNGIGTLAEKTVHAVLKHYLVPKEQCHEIKCNGYVADIMHGWRNYGNPDGAV
jgi:hypothetical protein